MFPTKVRTFVQQWSGPLALFLVLAGGTAYATHPGGANTIGSGDIIDQQVRTQDIRDEAVTASKVGPSSVGSGKIANGQVQVEDLAPSASGARAWGLVNAVGDLLRSKNVSDVDHPTTGIYCIDPAPGIDPTTAVMVIGEDSSGNFTNLDNRDVSHTEWRSGAPNCPAETMEVQTFVGLGDPRTLGELDEGGFDLVSLDQHFTFVIP